MFDVKWIMDVERPIKRNSRVLFSDLKETYLHKLVLNKERPECREVVVLQNIQDFWGYVPVIKLKVDFELVNTEYPNELLPILNQQNPVPPITLSILQDCQKDCYSDLQLQARTISSYIYGDTKSVEVNVQVQNIGNDAFDSVFRMTIPPGFSYQSYKRLHGRKVVCTYESYYENEILLCDLANPLRSKDGPTSFNVTLTHKSDNLLSSNYVLTMHVIASNAEKNETMSDNTITREIKITSDVKFSMYGKGIPNDEIFYDPKDSFYPKNGTLEELLGPEIVHTYSVENTGKTTIDSVDAYIVWPFSTVHENLYFLYLLNEPKISNEVVCQASNLNNVASVRINQYLTHENRSEAEVPKPPTFNEDSILTDVDQKRAKRDVEKQEEELKNFLSCTKFNCAHLKCTINSLTPGKIVQISVRFRLVVTTLQTLTNFTVKISTNCHALVTKLPVQIPPTHPLVTYEIQNLISPVPVKHSIPKLWLIILSADAGTLILLGMVVLLWRLGFFKRKHIPTDQDVKCAEYANQYKDKDLNVEHETSM